MSFLVPHYEPWTVAASIVIATFASYVALELSRRIASSDRRMARNWWIGGSLAMGSGIWAMHFVGMLAYAIPVSLGYTPLLTFVSWVAGVAVSGVALALAARTTLGARRLLGGSAVMGVGIFAMHYIGMAALDMAPPIVWDKTLVVASLAVAVGASAAALLIFFSLRRVSEGRALAARGAAAVVMGAAISGMHYTGMAAASFPAGSICLSAGSLHGSILGILVAVAAFTVLTIALLTSLFDARMQSQTARLAASLRASNVQLIGERERFRALTALSSDWFWEQDRNFRFTEISGFAAGGGTLPAHLGMTRWDMNPTRLNDAQWPAHRAALERHEAFQDFELRRLDAKGRLRWASTSGVPLFDASGEFIGYRGVGRDITDRKRDAQRQQMQREVTHVLADAESTRDALPAIIRSICEACMWEGGVFRALEASPEMPVDCGAAFWAIEGHGSTFATLSALRDAGENDRVAGRAGLGESFACETRVGDRLYGHLEFRASARRGAPEETLAAIRSIGLQVGQFIARRNAEAEVRGERALLEERITERTAELRETNRRLELAKLGAEDASRAKSAFLATMSHEIRTPMNGVIGMVDVLAESGLAEDQADAVQTIRSSGFTLLSLIDDILDFSKIEAGHLELEHMPVALAGLVEGIRGTLAPEAAIKAVELRLFVAPEVPEQVRTDPMRLRQVLYNLIGNAIKFSAGRAERVGRVSVRAEVSRAMPMELSISVTDNGIGIAPETLKNLFTPFTQAEASTTRRFGGTGLGLAISKRLVDLMGGTIDVQSEPGIGSVFRVHLPVEPIAGAVPCGYTDPKTRAALPQPAVDRLLRKAIAAPSIAEARARGSLLLIAEDDEVNQKVVLKQLTLLGYAAEVASNGAEALRLWREGGHALLLSDLHMPELDGYALAGAIRDAELSVPGSPRMPILALTANALHDEASRVRAAGMDEYLTKPIQLRALAAALQRWMPQAEQLEAPALMLPHGLEKPASLPVDVSVLKSLVGDDTETVREFLAEFLASAREQAAEIVASCHADDPRRVGAIAHKLKASSRSIGALALGDLCAELENACRAGSKAELAERRVRFEASMRDVQSCIVGVLAESAPT